MISNYNKANWLQLIDLRSYRKEKISRKAFNRQPEKHQHSKRAATETKIRKKKKKETPRINF